MKKLLVWLLLSTPFLITSYTFYPIYFRFLSPILFIALLMFLLEKGIISIKTSLTIYLLLVLLLLVDTGLLLFQGYSFDPRFYDLMTLDSMIVGFKQFPLYSTLIIVGFTIFSVASYFFFTFFKSKKKNCNLLSTIFIFLFLFLIPSSFSFFTNKYLAYQYFKFDLKKDISLQKIELNASKTGNLLLIYLESFESEFIEKKNFPNLTPFLQDFKEKSISFESNYQIQGADYSIAGMFASQCGAAFQYEKIENIVCLGDVLNAAGYQQIFMQGSDMSFEHIGEYYTLHGYDELYGKKKLPPIGDKNKVNSWGTTDEDLFEYAFQKFKKLNQTYIEEGETFNLTLFTSDTHNGMPSKSCPKYKGIFEENHFFQSYHCTDHLLGKFITKVLAQPGNEKLVIAILGDHLQNFDIYASQLNAMDRRVLALINTPENIHKKIKDKTSHITFTPTLLSALNIKHNATFLFGYDMLDSNNKNPLSTFDLKNNIFYKIINSKTWVESIGGEKEITNLYSYGSDIKSISRKEIKKYFLSKIKNYENYSQKNDQIFYSLLDNILFIKTDKLFNKVHIQLTTDTNGYFNDVISNSDAIHFEDDWYVWVFGNHFKVKDFKANIIEDKKNIFPIPINFTTISANTNMVNIASSIEINSINKNPTKTDLAGIQMQYGSKIQKAKFYISDLYQNTTYPNRIKYKIIYQNKTVFTGDIGDEYGIKKHFLEINLSPYDKNISIILEPQEGIEPDWSWGEAAKLKINFSESNL